MPFNLQDGGRFLVFQYFLPNRASNQNTSSGWNCRKLKFTLASQISLKSVKRKPLCNYPMLQKFTGHFHFFHTITCISYFRKMLIFRFRNVVQYWIFENMIMKCQRIWSVHWNFSKKFRGPVINSRKQHMFIFNKLPIGSELT